MTDEELVETLKSVRYSSHFTKFQVELLRRLNKPTEQKKILKIEIADRLRATASTKSAAASIDVVTLTDKLNEVIDRLNNKE